MAHLERRRTQNVSGDLYVDSICIDCDTCRWMAPEIFNSQEGQSAVYRQPASPQERSRYYARTNAKVFEFCSAISCSRDGKLIILWVERSQKKKEQIFGLVS